MLGGVKKLLVFKVSLLFFCSRGFCYFRRLFWVIEAIGHRAIATLGTGTGLGNYY